MGDTTRVMTRQMTTYPWQADEVTANSNTASTERSAISRPETNTAQQKSLQRHVDTVEAWQMSYQSSTLLL